MNRLALIYLLLLCFSAVFSPQVAPYDPTMQQLSDSLIQPGGLDKSARLHVLGTDSLGRDLASRLVFGSRVSLSMAAAIVISALIVGTVAGLAAGFYGGAIDSVVMRLADIQLSLPFILLAVALMAAVGPGIEKMILVLILVSWAIYARLVRGMVLSVKEREFIMAARAVGCPTLRLLFRHLLPNVMDLVIVVGTLEVAQMVIAEASLSYLGLGVQHPTVSWGSMLADGRQYLSTAWWLTAFPGIAIFLTVLSINVLGTSLRERMDQTLQSTKVG